MNLLRSIGKYLLLRRFERRFSCRVHPGGEILAKNRHRSDSITVGPGTHIRGQLFTFPHGGRIALGSDCYVGEHTKIWSAASLTIGDRVLIGHNTSIFDSNTHPIDATERHRHYLEIRTTGQVSTFDLREEPVCIEDDVWVGCNVVILKGVTIGRGTVIGAGSVVTRDMPPMVLVAGNPARVVRALNPSA